MQREKLKSIQRETSTSVQLLSHVRLFATPWTATRQVSLSITNSWSWNLSKLMSTESCPLSPWCHATSHPLSSPSIPAFNLFQHQGLFQWVSSSSQLQLKSLSFSWNVSASASVLPMNIQDWFPLGWTGWISLQSKGLSRVLYPTTVQKHQIFSTQLSL